MASQIKSLRVKTESSRIVKPDYDGIPPPITTLQIPLSVFDKVAYDIHVGIVYAFRPPLPSNSTIEKGLAKALAEYREWAGRLGEDSEGNPAVVLNDEGVGFVEASVEDALDKTLPVEPSPELLSLRPDVHGGVAELLRVKLTRFACGSLVLGYSAHHWIADGHAASKFLVAWGLGSRGLPIRPHAIHDRSTFFIPRRPPPRPEFEHRGVEFEHRALKFARLDKSGSRKPDLLKGNIKVHKAHFTKDFLTMLKARASSGASSKPYSTFVSLIAHLWRVVTTSRRLHESETTHVRISVEGRRRMRPRVPDEYFGNLVLWACPRAKVKELIGRPLQHAAKLIHDAVAGMNDAYFRSFIDFASSGAVESEDLVPTTDANEPASCPNLDVDSWLGFPFRELDFGGGSPFHCIPIVPTEGQIFLVPSFTGDGSIEAYVALFDYSGVSFEQICYFVD